MFLFLFLMALDAVALSACRVPFSKSDRKVKAFIAKSQFYCAKKMLIVSLFQLNYLKIHIINIVCHVELSKKANLFLLLHRRTTPNKY